MNSTTIKLTLLSLSLAVTASAQTVVTKEGVGEVAYLTDAQLPKAYDEARERALRAAIEQAAGVRIDADTVVVNNQLVRDQVFASTTGYVKSSEVIEKKAEKSVATVKVRADIITENLDRDIAAARDLVKQIGRPKVVILIQEQTQTGDGKAVTNSEVFAAALTEAFTADGWDIRDEKMFGNGKLTLEGAITMGPTQLKELHEVKRVDYVLYGKAAIRHEATSDFTKGTFPVSGDYDLALASTTTGAQIAKIAGPLRMSPRTKETLVSYERTAFQVINERKAEIIAPVRKAILEYFRDQKVNGFRFEVNTTGLTFSALKDFTKALTALKGMKEAEQGSFENGVANYRVVYLGSPTEFADALSETTFKKRKLNITAVRGSMVEVQVEK